MNNKRLPLYLIVLIVAVIAASFISAKLVVMQKSFCPEKEELSASPIAGFHKFASDVQWMRLVNYLGSLNTVDESNVQQVASKLQELMKLDPNLEKIYKEGALIMSIADPAQTIKFLTQACENPYLKNNWQIPFYAGYVMMHNSKPPQYAEAAKFFEMAMKRSGSDTGASYVVSSYFRAKAKDMVQKDKSLNGDERLALLKVLYAEWENNQKAGPDGSYSRGDNGIQNLNDRLIKALKDVKVASDDYKPSVQGKKFADKVIAKVFDKAHICSNCTAPYQAGEKFCSSCGSGLPVWGLCKNQTCKKVLKNGNSPFCSHCGVKQ